MRGKHNRKQESSEEIKKEEAPECSREGSAWASAVMQSAPENDPIINVVHDALISVRSHLVTSHNLFCRIETPYVHNYDSIKDRGTQKTYKRFNEKLEILRGLAIELVKTVSLENENFYIHLLVSLIGRIGECGEASSFMIYQLAKSAQSHGFSVIMVNINFGISGDRNYSHGFLVINRNSGFSEDFISLLNKNINCSCSDFFESLPPQAIIADPFLQVMFLASDAHLNEGGNISYLPSAVKYFYRYIEAYGVGPDSRTKGISSHCYEQRSLINLLARDENIDNLPSLFQHDIDGMQSLVDEEEGVLVRVFARYLHQVTAGNALLTRSIWGWKGPGPWIDSFQDEEESNYPTASVYTAPN